MVSDRRAADGGCPSRRNVLRLAAFLGVALVVPGTGAAAASAESLALADLALIAEVAEVIIPATDTGGAKAAGVPAFVGMMVSKWFDASERDNFVAGMNAFAAGALTRYGKPFVDLSLAEKSGYFGEQLKLAEASPPAPSAGGKPSRSSFAALMKRLTIYGYYTSELGGTMELSLNMVPNEYVPDAAFKPEDRADSFILYSLTPFSAY